MHIQHKDGEFFIEADGKKTVLDYRISSGNMDIYHTFTPDDLRGQGLAEKLAIAAFEFAKKEGIKIVPTCPYIRDYFIPKHPEFDDIVEK